MKVFIPMSDKLLSEQAAMSGLLVPFDPEFLLESIEIEKPDNWVPLSNLDQAKARLYQSSVSPH